jgi:hypothetical protein
MNIDVNLAEREERNKNMMKYMQEQLEFAKNNYEIKIKEQIK